MSETPLIPHESCPAIDLKTAFSSWSWTTPEFEILRITSDGQLFLRGERADDRVPNDVVKMISAAFRGAQADVCRSLEEARRTAEAERDDAREWARTLLRCARSENSFDIPKLLPEWLEDDGKEEEECICGVSNWEVSATMIHCRSCGRVWGRCNGLWILDTTTNPPKASPDDASTGKE